MIHCVASHKVAKASKESVAAANVFTQNTSSKKMYTKVICNVLPTLMYTRLYLVRFSPLCKHPR